MCWYCILFPKSTFHNDSCVILRAVQPRGQMLIPPTKYAGNENEWDRGQEQIPIKAVEYHWQMEHTE